VSDSADTGIGIAPTKGEPDIRRIRPGRQLDHPPLSAAPDSDCRSRRHLVTLMGGRIWLESAAGQGSTFHFSVDMASGDPHDLPAAPDSPAILPTEAGNADILLVEDNRVNQKVAIALLERRGYRVTVAENGALALELVTAPDAPFALILMDMQMPVMDGLEATRQIRSFEAAHGRPRLPIVAMTANAMQGDRENCVAAGMDDYVSKPIRADALYERINHFLKKG
jgi:CheY-like chemotaxis protein